MSTLIAFIFGKLASGIFGKPAVFLTTTQNATNPDPPLRVKYVKFTSTHQLPTVQFVVCRRDRKSAKRDYRYASLNDGDTF